MSDLIKIKQAIQMTIAESLSAGNPNLFPTINLLQQLIKNIEYQETFGDADLEGDRAAHIRGIS